MVKGGSMKIMGLSGGVDSCYLLHLYRNEDIVAVSFANGWDSEIATSNAKSMTKQLNIPYKIYSSNLEEFHIIQRAFLKASTPHGECPSDLAIKKTLLNAYREYKAESILTGSYVREGKPPLDWSLVDGRYLKDIVKRFEGIKIKTFPNMSLLDHIQYKRVTDTPLNRIYYNPKEVKEYLKTEYGWQDYGTKHYENIYTKFNQGLRYWKFGIDMRTLEMYGEYDLSKPPYPKEEFDKLCIKVGNILDIDMVEIMNAPPVNWRTYKSYRELIFWR